jgi:hypothetical protein
VLNKALKRLTVKIEGVDDSMTHSCNIVMLRCILNGVGHDQFARNRGDVEWGVAAGKCRICKCARREHPLEFGVIHLQGTRAEIRDIKPRRSAGICGDGKPLVDCSFSDNRVV